MNALKLANEIYNVIRAQKLGVNDYLPLILEDVIIYHENPKLDRENCAWMCKKLDESKSDGWYDGYICPTCGYVRGMDGISK